MEEVLAEAMTEAKAEQEKLFAKARAEQLLRQEQLMAKIDASRANSEKLRKAMRNCTKIYNNLINALRRSEVQVHNQEPVPSHSRKRLWMPFCRRAT